MPSTEKKWLLQAFLETIKPFRSNMKKKQQLFELGLTSKDKIYTVRANKRRRLFLRTKREFQKSSSRITRKRFRDQKIVILQKDNMKFSWHRLRILRRLVSMRTRFNSLTVESRNFSKLRSNYLRNIRRKFRKLWISLRTLKMKSKNFMQRWKSISTKLHNQSQVVIVQLRL